MIILSVLVIGILIGLGVKALADVMLPYYQAFWDTVAVSRIAAEEHQQADKLFRSAYLEGRAGRAIEDWNPKEWPVRPTVRLPISTATTSGGLSTSGGGMPPQPPYPQRRRTDAPQ